MLTAKNNRTKEIWKTIKKFKMLFLHPRHPVDFHLFAGSTAPFYHQCMYMQRQWCLAKYEERFWSGIAVRTSSQFIWEEDIGLDPKCLGGNEDLSINCELSTRPFSKTVAIRQLWAVNPTLLTIHSTSPFSNSRQTPLYQSLGPHRPVFLQDRTVLLLSTYCLACGTCLLFLPGFWLLLTRPSGDGSWQCSCVFFHTVSLHFITLI